MDAFFYSGVLMNVELLFSVVEKKPKGKPVVFLSFGVLRKTSG